MRRWLFAEVSLDEDCGEMRCAVRDFFRRVSDRVSRLRSDGKIRQERAVLSHLQLREQGHPRAPVSLHALPLPAAGRDLCQGAHGNDLCRRRVRRVEGERQVERRWEAEREVERRCGETRSLRTARRCSKRVVCLFVSGAFGVFHVLALTHDASRSAPASAWTRPGLEP